MSVLLPAWLGWMLVAVAGYWLMPDRLRDVWLAGVTLAFLEVHAPTSALILASFAAGAYCLTGGGRPTGGVTLGAGVALVAVLAFFKLRLAADFFYTAGGVAIPLGLSYYTLRCLHYMIERYKNTLPPHTFVDVVSYLFFLPTIIAGPIHRFGAFHRDSRRRRWNPQMFAEGLERILYGYVKITFLANYLISTWSAGFIADLDRDREALIAYLSVLQKGLNGYLQFSGYSDVAIGFALLLGHRVIENFNFPFLRKNIAEFWQSWHISLSSWCRDYVYMVVVSLTRRPAIGAIAALLVLGLWHEVSYRYILWGLYNGLGIVIWQRYQSLKLYLPRVDGGPLKVVADVTSVAVTFHFVMFGFVLVQEDTLAEALSIYRAIFFGWL